MTQTKKPSLVIMAGGEGTRLREVTGPDIPKPMVEVYEKPFLFWLVKNYVAQGFTEIVVSTGYKSEIIEEYPWPWRLSFRRDSPYFTKDGWYTNLRLLTNHWVVNGDTFIPESLPRATDPTILSCGDVDAGAQFVTYGKIKISPVKSFYDIGTPEGLNRFKEYFKTHLDKP